MIRRAAFWFALVVTCAYGRHTKQRDAAAAPFNETDITKIVGGYTTTIESYPYQVYLLLQRGNQYYQCGGSIISSSYILTAAHCLTGVSSVYVRAGSTNSDKGGTLVHTTAFRSHPRYNPTTLDYDVAVIRLQRALTLDGTSTKSIPLAGTDSTVSSGTEITVSGWGTISERGRTSETLMAVMVPAVSRSECQKAYGTSAITPRMLCAGLPGGGKDSCQGDSGGPAAVGNGQQQVGVVSFGRGCARPNLPGVYTDVAAVRSWIKANTGV